MRLLVGALICLAVGSLVGWAHVVWLDPPGPDFQAEVLATTSLVADGQATTAAAESGQSDPSRPAQGRTDVGHFVSVNGTVFDFGVMARDTKGMHQFMVKNEGEGPLELRVENTTCKCTLAEVGAASLAPGATTEVVLEWEAKGADEEFRHGATLRTNDPLQPTVMLTVRGRIMHVVQAIPAAVQVDKITVHDEQEHRVRVLAYRPEKLQFHDAEFVEETIRNRFAYSLHDVPSEEIAKYPDAQNGIDVVIKILPGLPMGPFRQTLRFVTSYEEFNTLEIPISGVCASDISIIGRKYSPDRQLLHWGVIDGAKGDRCELIALVRGGYRAGFEIALAASDPPNLFRVEVGEGTPHGSVTKVPITIHIDPGHDPVSRLAGKTNDDYGRLDFRTNHPDAPTLTIFVQFGIK
jgi:Protein of unknown function (DUF1573)